ncbi:hypothetical protein [Spiroplasma cantharicola]|uniref:Uncharacterized protein n=1 Tax=Spiroplasma cantharicola TaxID=362837 RepID=A0A0M3SJ84_9MOLU|nr:hypothetical protein [Spiroplasma cantharicola]ALD66308.1 hypothetical protein SCANT_v1c03980 [Spiroplasma cantharicola]
MLGKYDFNQENAEKIFKFYNPVLQIVLTLLNEQKSQLKQDNIISNDFDKLFNYFKNIKYLDQFKEFKDMFDFFYYDFLNKLILLNKDEIVDRHRYWPNLVSIKQVSQLLDHWIGKSYDNMKKDKEVISLFDCFTEIKNLIINYCNTLIKQNFNKKFIKTLDDIKNANDFNIIENLSERIINMIEYDSLNDEKVHNILEVSSQKYWNEFSILINISILSVLAIQIKEENALQN